MVVKRLSIATLLLVSTLGVSLLCGQEVEFPEKDELFAEQVVVVPFRTGLIDKGKVRKIYRHVERVPRKKTIVEEEEVSYFYTLMPHPVRKELVKKQIVVPEEKWIVSPQVGVKPISGRTSRSTRGKSRR